MENKLKKYHVAICIDGNNIIYEVLAENEVKAMKQALNKNGGKDEYSDFNDKLGEDIETIMDICSGGDIFISKPIEII